jgi:hypothetical protein
MLIVRTVERENDPGRPVDRRERIVATAPLFEQLAGLVVLFRRYSAAWRLQRNRTQALRPTVNRNPKRARAVGLTVDFAGSDWLAAKSKVGPIRVSQRPAAGSSGKREDFLRGRRVQIDARSAAISQQISTTLGGSSGALDLVDCNRVGSQEAENDSDTMRHTAVSRSPAPQAPRPHAEDSSKALLRDAKRAKSLAGVARE